MLVEEQIVLQDLPDLPTFGYLFGLIDTLNLKHSKDLRYTFETVQKIFMELGRVLYKGQVPQKQTPSVNPQVNW